MVDRVDSEACGILLDTFHMNIEEKSIGDAIRAAGSRLKHLHGCENDRGAPGSGHVPWKEVAAAVKDAGYDGPVVIESFTDQGEDDRPRRGDLEVVRNLAGRARAERAEVPARAAGVAAATAAVKSITGDQEIRRSELSNRERAISRRSLPPDLL